MTAYQNQDWYVLYCTAILELESLKLTGRIHDARSGITARLEVLKIAPGVNIKELQAIEDALRMLRVLEHENPAKGEKKP
jgi:hypothetical protein